MAIGVRVDLESFGHQMQRLDDLGIFGSPIPYHIAALLDSARSNGKGEEDIAAKPRAIAGLRAAEVYYKAFQTDNFITWLPVGQGDKVQFEIMQSPVTPFLAGAILTFLQRGETQVVKAGVLGAVGLSPQTIDDMVKLLNNQGFDLRLPTSEELGLLAEGQFLWREMMELTASVEGEKRVARRLLRPGHSLKIEEQRLVLPDEPMPDVTFRLVRRSPLPTCCLMKKSI